MSEIYEGIVCKAEKNEVYDFLNLRQILKFNLKKVNSKVLLILLTENLKREFSPDSEKVAQELSLRFHESLVFQYDSRVGYRVSRLFVDGKLKKVFEVKDELYMTLDDEGEPDKNKGLFRYSEMLENEEYETSENAIDIGLKKLSSNLSWKILKQFLIDI